MNDSQVCRCLVPLLELDDVPRNQVHCIQDRRRAITHALALFGDQVLEAILQGSGFRGGVRSLGFRGGVGCLGFRVRGSGFRGGVGCLGFRVQGRCRMSRVQGSGAV